MIREEHYKCYLLLHLEYYFLTRIFREDYYRVLLPTCAKFQTRPGRNVIHAAEESSQSSSTEFQEIFLESHFSTIRPLFNEDS